MLVPQKYYFVSTNGCFLCFVFFVFLMSPLFYFLVKSALLNQVLILLKVEVIAIRYNFYLKLLLRGGVNVPKEVNITPGP